MSLLQAFVIGGAVVFIIVLICLRKYISFKELE